MLMLIVNMARPFNKGFEFERLSNDGACSCRFGAPPKKVVLSSLGFSMHVIVTLTITFLTLFSSHSTIIPQAWLDRKVLSSLALGPEELLLLPDLQKQASRSLSWRRMTLPEADAR